MPRLTHPTTLKPPLSGNSKKATPDALSKQLQNSTSQRRNPYTINCKPRSCPTNYRRILPLLLLLISNAFSTRRTTICTLTLTTHVDMHTSTPRPFPVITNDTRTTTSPASPPVYRKRPHTQRTPTLSLCLHHHLHCPGYQHRIHKACSSHHLGTHCLRSPSNRCLPTLPPGNTISANHHVKRNVRPSLAHHHLCHLRTPLHHRMICLVTVPATIDKAAGVPHPLQGRIGGTIL
jgi:hypothetical protein